MSHEDRLPSCTLRILSIHSMHTSTIAHHTHEDTSAELSHGVGRPSKTAKIQNGSRMLKENVNQWKDQGQLKLSSVALCCPVLLDVACAICSVGEKDRCSAQITAQVMAAMMAPGCLHSFRRLALQPTKPQCKKWLSMAQLNSFQL